MTEETKRHTLLRAFIAIARHHGVELVLERLLHEYAIDRDEVPERLLFRIARESGFRVRKVRLDWAELFEVEEAYPFIARLNNGNDIVLAGVRGTPEDGQLAIFDPLTPRPDFLFVDREHFERLWDGEAVLIRRHYGLTESERPFGLAWFGAEILREKSLFGRVALAALVLHALGLAVPVFFQVVIDKILVHNSFSTLTTLGIGVVIALTFEATLSFLRSLLLLHATNRIDVRLAYRTFDHLLHLPLSFFESSSAGVITKHMQQAEQIREFMTGKLFLTLLDAAALLVFIPVLMLYSLKLSLVVLLFSALIGSVVIVALPIFRRRLQELYRADGQRQALLVETIHGMRTVKALAIEPWQKKRWAEYSARSIFTRFRAGRLSSAANALVTFFERLLTVVIVWYGALLVFEQEISIGVLVAVQMLAGRVSGPLVQIVSLVNEFQQTVLSVRMLGEVMNRKPERAASAGALMPRLTGEIVFDNVSFSYPGTQAPALAEVSMTIPSGSVVGVVGRSGSGKTTMTRLLQGIYLPQHGHIRVDGLDLRDIELSHLRRSVGIVVQESFLFRGTVRENVAVTKPEASLAEVVAACRAAGADEFIRELPQGYDTPLEENGANLSGGQQQRLSIARSLLPGPPILIFDEATSALDPDSEAIVQKNLARIAQGRTLIIVSHRLASIAGADFTLVFEHGRLVDCAPHARLLESSPIYRHLWQQQIGERLAAAPVRQNAAEA
jgi:ATP-binding cassette, subfamily B, bacterial HlyB/CyaB